MDRIQELTNFLGDPIKYWEFYESIVDHNPGWAVVIGIPVVIYLGYIFLGQLVGLLKRYRSVMLLGARRATGISLLLIAAAAFVSYLMVESIQVARAVRPAIKEKGLFLGQTLLINWTYGKQNNEQQMRYEVQTAVDSRFTKDMRIENKALPGTLYQFFHDFNQSRFVRVRAVELIGETASDVQTRPLSPWSEPVEITQYGSALDRIRKTGRVAVYTSVSLNQGLFAFTTREGKLTGFDIELGKLIVNALGQRLGVQLEEPRPVSVEWEEMLRMPKKGDADFIIASITSRPEREGKYGFKFSNPYYETTQALIYREGSGSGSALKLLPGRTVGVQTETTGEALVRTIDKTFPAGAKMNIRQYKQTVGIVNALRNGEVDYVVTDAPFAEGAIRKGAAPQLGFRKFAATDFPNEVTQADRSEPYAIAVRSAESELLALINEILTELKTQGKLTKLMEDMKQVFASHQNGK